jgi:hypothetical protein
MSKNEILKKLWEKKMKTRTTREGTYFLHQKHVFPSLCR